MLTVVKYQFIIKGHDWLENKITWRIVFVTKLPTLIMLITRDCVAQRLSSVSSAENKTLAATRLKIIKRWRHLWHDGRWQRTPTDNIVTINVAAVVKTSGNCSGSAGQSDIFLLQSQIKTPNICNVNLFSDRLSYFRISFQSTSISSALQSGNFSGTTVVRIV